MSEYMFLLGKGWLPKKADKIAQKHGAYLVNYTDPQCSCGCGCVPYECKKSRRHWFAKHNMGNPFDQSCARAVEDDLVKVGLTKEAVK